MSHKDPDELPTLLGDFFSPLKKVRATHAYLVELN